jgi:hypothetical protein
MSNDYNKYPKLNIIGLDLSNVDRKEINNDDWDWSLDTLFAIKKMKTKSKFKFEHSVKEMFRYVLEHVIAKVEKFNTYSGQRAILNQDSPSVIMCFIPSDNISVISNLLKVVINQISNDLEVCVCNTTDTSFDIKHNINQSLVIAQNTKKKAVIALTGKQGHLGVTIEKCDLVLLMNNSRSMD